jgi:hypothetical protein
MWRKQIRKISAVSLVVLSLVGAPVLAQESSSPNYRVNEYQFGSGGNVDNTSANYQANTSVGSLGVGRSASTNYFAEAGFVTPNEPFLELFVNTTTVNLGTLDPSTTATGTAVFWVRTYLSSNYVVQTMSPSLTSEGGAVINAKGTLGVPTTGTEEFGINLVDNATPDIGANLLNVPDDTYADGEIVSGYNTPNQFKYAQGDIIARSAASVTKQAVGRTDYTISYIANISSITEAGSYTMVHNIVVTGTY